MSEESTTTNREIRELVLRELYRSSGLSPDRHLKIQLIHPAHSTLIVALVYNAEKSLIGVLLTQFTPSIVSSKYFSGGGGQHG